MQNGESAIVALMAVFAYIFGGVIFYWQSVPAWSLTDAFYFVAVTLSSVGYGDLTPEGDWLKLFTAAYILIGVAILGTALGEVVSSLLEVDAETPASRALEWLTGAGKGAELEGESCDGRRELCDVDLLMAGGGDAIGDLLRTLGTVGVTIGAGSAAFLYFDESRSSSLVDALYSSVVTLTTVGYGDIVPESSTARTFVGVYSLFGTVLLARSLGALAALPLERRRQYQQQLVLEQYGDELDAVEFDDLRRTIDELGLCDLERGYCTKGDFALAMLVRQDKCTVADVQTCLNTFQKLDADGSGELDRADVELFQANQASAQGLPSPASKAGDAPTPKAPP